MRFSDELRAACAGLWRASAGHPFVRGIGDGSLPVERFRYFIAPQGGGMKTEFAGAPIQVITPRSPIGRALLGKTVGEIVELRLDRGAREYEVVSVE